MTEFFTGVFAFLSKINEGEVVLIYFYSKNHL